MKIFLLFLSFLFFSGCAGRSAVITRQDYDSVLLGCSIYELIGCLGEPYAIHCLRYGGEEYEYIERFSMNSQLAYETHYYIRVVNGQIVSKRICQEMLPAYDLLYQVDPNYPRYPFK